MWPFTERDPIPFPLWVKHLVDQVPEGFIDDGCSKAPDRWLGFDLRHACRLHDWAGCTRCHPSGALTLAAMVQANTMLELVIAAALPARWQWIKFFYYAAVKRFNGDVAWDSCGPESGATCRHGMSAPAWMRG
jgi:hypothetical protein